MTKLAENHPQGTANIADDRVLATVLNMNIVVTRLDKEHIDVRDTAGIRLMLLNPIDNKGLFTYFEIRLSW